MKISETAYQVGFGKQLHRGYVQGLSKSEKSEIKKGEEIFFQASRKSGGKHGTYWRKAIEINNRFYSRVPNEEIITQLEKNQ